MAERQGENRDSSKADAELWLEGIGLPAASIDPLSLDALSDLLSGQRVDFDDPMRQQHIKLDEDSLSNKAAIDQSQRDRDSLVDHASLPPDDNDHKVSATGKAQPSATLGVDEEEQINTASIPEEATPVERLILEQLHQQTHLIKKLERRLNNIQAVPHTSSSSSASQSHRDLNAKTQPRNVEATSAVNNREAHNREARFPERPPEAAPRPRVVVHRRAFFRDDPPPPQQQERENGMGASRVYKCIVLFLALRRQQVPNDRIDGWMLIKIMFMLSLLLSKDQSKLFTTMSIVIVGFLWQSGLAAFLYKFVVRYNYVGRILLYNEDITVASALAEQRQPTAPVRAGEEAQQQQQQQQRQWWHANPDRPAIYNMMIDIVMVFGSLFLSIFPMWRVPDPPAPPPAEQEENDRGDDRPEGGGMIPEIRPPVDPAVTESDDEQDENNNLH